MATESRRPAVSLSVVEDHLAPEDLVPIELIEVGEVFLNDPPQSWQIDSRDDQ